MCSLLLVLVVATPLLGARAASAGQSDAISRDVTFFVISDPHIGAENTQADPPLTGTEALEKAKADLTIMQQLVGRPYPQNDSLLHLNLGAVKTPHALMILGDLTDGHDEPTQQREQWETFNDVFPADGLAFGDRAIPVFAIAGNHDGEVAGPQRRGLIERNHRLETAGHLAALSENGAHFAVNVDGVHLIGLNLCAADTTDTETPFKYGQPGRGSWNDPQGALSFLQDYLDRRVGSSGEPVIIMQHYGFDSFSLNDWNWWTPRQRQALYESIEGCNVVAFFHGHNHYAEHYRWPDPQRHATDLAFFLGDRIPPDCRQYDVISWGRLCWVIRIRGNLLIAAHFNGSDWTDGDSGLLVKSLTP